MGSHGKGGGVQAQIKSAVTSRKVEFLTCEQVQICTNQVNGPIIVSLDRVTEACRSAQYAPVSSALTSPDNPNSRDLHHLTQ